MRQNGVKYVYVKLFRFIHVTIYLYQMKIFVIFLYENIACKFNEIDIKISEYVTAWIAHVVTTANVYRQTINIYFMLL